MKSIHEAYIAVSGRVPIEDIKVLQRLDRGKGILDSYGYSVDKQGDNSYLVKRASTSLLEDNSATYTVDQTSCTCPDFETARGGLCKHRFAVMLLQEMEQE